MRRNKNAGRSQKAAMWIMGAAITLALVWGLVSVWKTGNEKRISNEQVPLDFNAEAFEPEETGSRMKSEQITVKETEKQTEKQTEKPTQMAENEPERENSSKEETLDVSDTNITNKYVFSENDSLTWPVEGGIILGYSMDRTIWFPTLEVYKCNPGVVISAVEGCEVKAAASGVVESIDKTKEYGLVFTVNIGNGYKTLYGQMNNSNNLVVGSTVHEGEVIGTVSRTTSYYSVEGDNLFFKLVKDDVPQNPLTYLDVTD